MELEKMTKAQLISQIQETEEYNKLMRKTFGTLLYVTFPVEHVSDLYEVLKTDNKKLTSSVIISVIERAMSYASTLTTTKPQGDSYLGSIFMLSEVLQSHLNIVYTQDGREIPNGFVIIVEAIKMVARGENREGGTFSDESIDAAFKRIIGDD